MVVFAQKTGVLSSLVMEQIAQMACLIQRAEMKLMDNRGQAASASFIFFDF